MYLKNSEEYMNSGKYNVFFESILENNLFIYYQSPRK